jgi:hypothetical protein
MTKSTERWASDLAGRNAYEAPSLIGRLSRVPPRQTPPNTDPLSPNACYGRRAGGASVKRSEWS